MGEVHSGEENRVTDEHQAQAMANAENPMQVLAANAEAQGMPELAKQLREQAERAGDAAGADYGEDTGAVIPAAETSDVESTETNEIFIKANLAAIASRLGFIIDSNPTREEPASISMDLNMDNPIHRGIRDRVYPLMGASRPELTPESISTESAVGLTIVETTDEDSKRNLSAYKTVA